MAACGYRAQRRYWSLYLDGTAYDLSGADATPAIPSSGFVVGGSQTPLQGFNGVIDEVKFWTTARTTEQIGADMTACNTAIQTGLQAYWKFNEGTGTSVADASGNGFALTTTGADWVSAEEPLSTYAWNFGDGNTSAVNNATHSYTATGTYTSSLTVTNETGCTASASVIVTVNSLSGLSAGSPVTICRGSATTLRQRRNDLFMVARNRTERHHRCERNCSPTVTTTYTVTGNVGGCSNTATVTVSVNALPTVTTGGGTTICAGRPQHSPAVVQLPTHGRRQPD